MTRWQINEDVLLDSSFGTKRYKITVENGRFYPMSDPKGYSGSGLQLSFGLRRIFNESPYPPKEVWRPEQMCMVESMRQFEMMRNET